MDCRGGSILAFIAFGAVALREIHQRRMDDQEAVTDRREAHIQRRRAQAERITYYLEKDDPGDSTVRAPVDAAEFGAGAHELDVGILVIVNNSESCVYEPIASVPKPPDSLKVRGIGVIPPGQTRIRFPMKYIERGGSSAWRRVGDFANNRLVTWVQFGDSTGVTWRRFGDGQLDEPSGPVAFPDYSP